MIYQVYAQSWAKFALALNDLKLVVFPTETCSVIYIIYFNGLNILLKCLNMVYNNEQLQCNNNQC